MIDFSYIFFGILLGTFIPAYAALYLFSYQKVVSVRYLAAAGVGLTFWFFFDTMGDAVALDENSALYPPSLFGGLPHLGLILAFAAGVATLAILDYAALGRSRPSISQSQTSKMSTTLVLIPVAIALVMGIHSLGEGWDASSAVASASTTGNSMMDAMIQAFGSFSAVVSYPIHKFLEAAIIGAAFAAFVPIGARKSWHLPLLGILFGAPSVLGASLGYYISLDTSYFFAFGVTAALYAALRLVEPLRNDFQLEVNAPAELGPKVFIALAIGFFLLYTAALLH